MENTIQLPTDTFTTNPYYNEFGGAFVPEVLTVKLQELSNLMEKLDADETFDREFLYYLNHFVGRPSPMYFARRLSDKYGIKLYLKREDLNHTGSHKINNTIGQILVAKRMGAKEIIAETGAGQHGVATATAAAMLGLRCIVFMGAEDAKRQSLNVKRMHLLGAQVITTSAGRGTLKDAVDAALGYYINNPESYYLLGSQVGPHPYPRMVARFQRVIGREARAQILEAENQLPHAAVACIGGGSNAIGLFQGFIDDQQVELHGAEGGGEGFLGKTAATLSLGRPAIFQGTNSYCLLDENDEPLPSYSIAAGLDYPGISPQHAMLKTSKRAAYHIITDNEAIAAFRELSTMEGITPAVESAHAVALAFKKFAKTGKTIVVNLSGRGDKDIDRIPLS
ncbi:MAG: tryptophan synthase subunit beta [Salinivirgaceae bacterium]